MPKVNDGIFGTIEHHSWTYPAHHLLNLLTLLGSIAVNGTLPTRPFVFSKLTMFETLTGIFCQLLILLWHDFLLKTMTAIQRYHLTNRLLLPIYPVHPLLISKILTDKHYRMPTFISAVSQKVDITANAFRRVAIVASAVYSAWGLDIKSLGVDG